MLHITCKPPHASPLTLNSRPRVESHATSHNIIMQHTIIIDTIISPCTQRAASQSAQQRHTSHGPASQTSQRSVHGKPTQAASRCGTLRGLPRLSQIGPARMVDVR